MKIRYLSNGIDEIEEADVMAAGSHTFYVRSDRVGVLLAVPEGLVVSSITLGMSDNPPSISEYIKFCKEIKDVDFTLMDLFKTEH